MRNMNSSWQNLSLILLSTVAVVADGLEISDAFASSAGTGTSSIETDSMHGGWQPVMRYSYWIPPLPEPNVSGVGVVAVVVRLVLCESSVAPNFLPSTFLILFSPPQAKCIGETKLRVGLNGEFSCLMVGEALCRDNAENIKKEKRVGNLDFGGLV